MSFRTPSDASIVEKGSKGTSADALYSSTPYRLSYTVTGPLNTKLFAEKTDKTTAKKKTKKTVEETGKEETDALPV